MNLLTQYLALSVFKNNPAELVPTRPFMQKVMLFYFFSGWLVEGLIADPADGFLEVSLRMIMALSTIALSLFICKQWDVFYQLFTAIFVGENFIMTLATAVEVLDVYMVLNSVEYSEEISISLACILVVWYLLIVAYILRKFFLFDVRSSVILAFSYFVLTYGVPMLFMDI